MSSYISSETPPAGSRGVMAHEINSQRVKYAGRRPLPSDVLTLESKMESRNVRFSTAIFISLRGGILW